MAKEGFSEDKKSLVCRVCLHYAFQIDLGPGLSLFEKYNDCVIFDQINELTNLTIKEGDGFPDRICPTCHLQLQSAYKFKKTCESTNQILLSSAKHVLQKCNSPVEILPVKKECLDDVSDADNNIDDNDADENVDDSLLNELQDDKMDEKYIKMESLIRPSRAIHLKLECHDCGDIFKSKCKLLAHWKKSHLKCFRCSKLFKTFGTLKTHKEKNLKSCVTAGNFNIEGEGKDRVFHCKECDYKTKFQHYLKVHVLKHSENNPYKCHICPRAFLTAHNLKRHIEGAHKIYSFEGTCQYCGKHIQGKIKMEDHLKSHKKKKEQFECKICNSVLSTKSNLTIHMKKHSGVKAYVCEVCSKSFFTSGSLYCHRTKTHLKSKSYTCEICGYKSFWHSTMSKHKKKHSGPGVACNICGTFLHNEVQLSMHKLRHTEKHHQCSHCDKKCFNRSLLCAHIRKIHKVSLAK